MKLAESQKAENIFGLGYNDIQCFFQPFHLNGWEIPEDDIQAFWVIISIVGFCCNPAVLKFS